MTVPYCIGPRPVAAREPEASLRFALPPALLLRAQAGRYAPLLHKIGLVVDDAGMVSLGAYDCDLASAMPALREQALRFLLTLHETRMAPQSFAAELVAGDRWKENYLIALGARAVMAQGARGVVMR